MADVDGGSEEEEETGIDSPNAKNIGTKEQERHPQAGTTGQQRLSQVGPAPRFSAGLLDDVAGDPEVLDGVPEHDPEEAVLRMLERERVEAHELTEVPRQNRDGEPYRLNQNEEARGS
jgi:hypothetical protein